MTNESQRSSMDFMMETYGFTEEELRGIYLDKLIEDYQLRTREYTREEIQEILTDEGDMYVFDDKTALYTIFDAEGEASLTESDDEISRIAFYVNNGTQIQRMIFDLENNVFYVDDDTAYELTEEQTNMLERLPAEYGITKWESHTEGKEEPSTGNYDWKLIFQLSDGHYAIYDGYTKDMSHLPDNYSEVNKALRSIAKNAN